MFPLVSFVIAFLVAPLPARDLVSKADHCYVPGSVGTPDVTIPGTPGLPAIPGTPTVNGSPGTPDIPGTPGTPSTVIPGIPPTPGMWVPCG